MDKSNFSYYVKVFKFAEVVVVSFFLFFGSNPTCKFEIHLLVVPNKKNPLIGLFYSESSFLFSRVLFSGAFLTR